MYANQACRRPVAGKESWLLYWETEFHKEFKRLKLLLNSNRIRQNMGNSKDPHLDIKENKIFAIQIKTLHIVCPRAVSLS